MDDFGENLLYTLTIVCYIILILLFLSGQGEGREYLLVISTILVARFTYNKFF